MSFEQILQAVEMVVNSSGDVVASDSDTGA